MHSRIFEISDKPIQKAERFSFNDIPDWFFSSIADYAGDIDDEYRDSEIKWLAESFRGSCSRDGDKLTFEPETREKYFLLRYSRFMELAAKLTGYSYEAFSGEEGRFSLEHALFEVNDAYEDKFAFYVYDPRTCELETLHNWLRSTDLTVPHYVGGIIDYHW